MADRRTTHDAPLRPVFALTPRRVFQVRPFVGRNGRPADPDLYRAIVAEAGPKFRSIAVLCEPQGGYTFQADTRP